MLPFGVSASALGYLLRRVDGSLQVMFVLMLMFMLGSGKMSRSRILGLFWRLVGVSKERVTLEIKTWRRS